MATFDQEEAQDSFEIEFTQLPGAAVPRAMRFWRARQPKAPNAIAPSSTRKIRYSRVAVLVAIACVVLVNCLDLSWLFPAVASQGARPAPVPLTGNVIGAQARNYSWFGLRQRPLHLPKLASGAACPVTSLSQWVIQFTKFTGIGNATIFAVTPNLDHDGVQRPVRGDFGRLSSTYSGEVVTWSVKLPDSEPALIRGAQINGPGILLFDGGLEQPKFDQDLLAGRALPELLISSDPSRGTPIAQWLTVTRIPGSGCYAYQIDTPTQSLVLVFKAIVSS